MSNYKLARDFYDNIIKLNGYQYMSMIWTIDCIENSLQVFDMDLIITDEEKEKMCNLVLNSWLNTPYNIGISKIADLVVENWNELKDSNNTSEMIGDYIADEIGF